MTLAVLRGGGPVSHSLTPYLTLTLSSLLSLSSLLFSFLQALALQGLYGDAISELHIALSLTPSDTTAITKVNPYDMICHDTCLILAIFGSIRADVFVWLDYHYFLSQSC